MCPSLTIKAPRHHYITELDKRNMQFHLNMDQHGQCNPNIFLLFVGHMKVHSTLFNISHNCSLIISDSSKFIFRLSPTAPCLEEDKDNWHLLNCCTTKLQTVIFTTNKLSWELMFFMVIYCWHHRRLIVLPHLLWNCRTLHSLVIIVMDRSRWFSQSLKTTEAAVSSKLLNPWRTVRVVPVPTRPVLPALSLWRGTTEVGESLTLKVVDFPSLKQ